jgi:predicted dehydrogenase
MGNLDRESTIDRRAFLSRSAKIAAGTAIATTALSYSRILGANDRISLGHIGIGNRGRGLDSIVAKLKGTHNVEMTAVCDLWSVNREKAVQSNQEVFGRAPRGFARPDELLALRDVDAVLIATPEHSHSPLLTLAAEAGKDAYCEKPMGNLLADIKAARDAVLQHKRVVQIGTQHRSELYPRAAHDLVKTGVLGEVSKVEVEWNFHGPRWRGRPEVAQLREQDTDWRAWLMTRPARPFDPRLYFEYRLYKDFSSGIADQWMSHGIDLIHWFMDDPFPKSVVAHGGIFAWPDGRENPDTFHALLEYPKGFLASYSTSFGNDAPSFTRYMGKNATLLNIGGEGSPRYQLVEEKGVHESDPDVYDKRKATDVRLPGETAPPPTSIDDDDLHHMDDWFQCLRSRQDPHATVREGFAHSVACIMAARSYWEGRKLYWDKKTEEIVETPPTS